MLITFEQVNDSLFLNTCLAFFEVRMNRAAFEVIKKDTSRNRQINDVGDSME